MDKKFKVEVFRYPETLVIDASSKKEAIEIARRRVEFCVWECKAEQM